MLKTIRNWLTWTFGKKTPLFPWAQPLGRLLEEQRWVADEQKFVEQYAVNIQKVMLMIVEQGK